ncbi:hypothetical protein CHUAL_001223 [Chamberlinius hualienensis]
MMEGFSMDIDVPFGSNNKGSNLKRSSSAPMINILASRASSNPCTGFREEPAVPQPLFESQNRSRRFSASFSVSPSSSPSSPYHIRTSRISQIKHEEGMDVLNREVAHERKVQSALQISQSWEDLTLASESDHSKRPRCFTEPLHIFPSTYPLSSSPSPTRLGKQCFSPSMQQPVRNSAFATSPVPSPTRKSVTRRSLSPIALRPSQLHMKRKFDGDKLDFTFSPQKKFHPSSNSDRLTHRLSSSSLDDSPSSDQTPIHRYTPESMSSVDSPCNMFKTVDQDAAMQDSEPPTPTSEGLPNDNM